MISMNIYFLLRIASLRDFYARIMLTTYLLSHFKVRLHDSICPLGARDNPRIVGETRVE